MSKTWKSYSNQFKQEAIKSGVSANNISKWLEYAKELFDQKLPIIYDQIHLSLLVGYEIDYLRKISNSAVDFYRVYTITKEKGGYRKIAEPFPSLKEIQRWLLDNLLYKVKVSRFAKAYREDKSIKSNAWFHLNKDLVLRIDIKNFFDSIKFNHVYGMYSRLGYNKPVSVMLSKLCLLEDQLPQGAPTSPAISNIVMREADKRISSFITNKGIRYTRYADDLIFSGEFDPGMVIKFVKSVLNDYGLNVNVEKTRVFKQHQRQLVTGIVVNEKLQAPRDMRRKLRQAVYYIEKFGLDSHLEHTNNDRANHVRHLLGIANFILFINPGDEETKEYKELLITYLEY